MHFQTHVMPSLVFLLLTTPITALLPASDKVLLSKVKTLTLRKDASTAHRRVPAAPQLKCLTPRACKHYQVDIMRCTNQGSDYDDENIQWSCTANMPEDFKLGSTDVICEGYESSDDHYVLKGSCGVEYRLVLTDKGEERYGKGGSGEGGGESEWTDTAKTLFWLLFVGVAVWILWGIWKGLPGNRRAPTLGGNGGPRGGGGGGGWGGGNGGYDDNDDPPSGPPPPYNKYGSTYDAPPANRNSESWRPGFWSGLAAGGVGGYGAGHAVGSRSNRSNRSANSDTPRYSPSPPRASSSSSSSPSSIQHSSTGFGSTSRR